MHQNVDTPLYTHTQTDIDIDNMTEPQTQAYSIEVAIGCTVNCRASVIIYRVLEFMAFIN